MEVVMAYREPAPGVRCYRHEAAPAAAVCRRCEKAICGICLVYEATVPHCPSCAKSIRRTRMIGRAAVLVLLLAAVSGAAVFLITRKPPFDYGKLAPQIRELRGKLEGEPCHRGNALALSQRLLEAGDG